MNRATVFFAFILTIFFGCNTKGGRHAPVSQGEVIIDAIPGECPYLTKDTKGIPVLSWVRMINDSTTEFSYSSWNGKSFSDPVIIPGSNHIQPHGENLPKIIFKPSGEIIALWGEANANPTNKYSGLVSYVQSFDNGRTWTKPKPLINDTASFDQRYYDVALLPNGEVGIIWLDNRKTTNKEGSGLYFATTQGGSGFQHDRLVSQPCCQCCRTDLFVDGKGNIHALYRGILQDSIRDMVHIVSTDAGNTFSPPKKISDDNWVINGCPHTGPAMAESNRGLEFAWFTGGKNKGCYYSCSKDNGLSFSPRSAVSEFGSHPQLTSNPNGDIIIAWDETVKRNNEYFKRIGIQKRNELDKSPSVDFITPDTSMATYPVVSLINSDEFLVAYSIKNAKKNYIGYQIITFK